MKIQKGDEVIVLKGSDKKKVGKVVLVLEERERIVIEGVNIRTLHIKPKSKNEKGHIEKREMPISISNVALLDPKTKKATRVIFEGIGRDKKRLSKKSGSVLGSTSSNKKSKAKKTAVKPATAKKKAVSKK